MTAKQLPLFPSEGQQHLQRTSTLREAVPSFLDHLRKEGKSQHTINSFESDLRLLAEYAGDDAPLKSFTTTELSRFMMWIENGRGAPCSRKSYARRVTTLKVFFKYLREADVLPDDQAAALLQRSGAAPLQPILTDRDIEQLLAYTAGLRIAKKPDARPDMLLQLLLDTGIKKSECMALTRENIVRTKRAEPLVVIRYGKRKDVYKERKIALKADWLDVYDEYLAQYDTQDVLFDCTARNLEYVLTDTAKGAGVANRISFAILRWTSAVRDYRAGMDMDALREKMGLSRISWRETSEKIVQLAVKLQRTSE